MTNLSRVLLATSSAFAMVIAAHSVAVAADDNWSNAATSFQNWSTGTNWDLGTAPTAGQSAAIANGGGAAINSAVTFTSLAVSGNSQLELTNGADLSGGGAISLASGSTLRNDATSGTITLANVISGAGGLVQGGAGTLILTGANTYTGATGVTAGTLQLGTGGSLAATTQLGINGNGVFDINGHTQTVGALSSTSGTASILLGSGALTVSGAFSSQFAGVISGAGSVTVSGTGSLLLTGANTYTGGTTITTGGNLIIGNFGTTGSITGNVVDNGTLNISRSDTYFFAGNISGSGQLNENVSGAKLILTGTNSYTGATVIAAGTTVQVGNVGTAGTLGTGNVSNSGSLVFSRSDSLTVANAISGSGSVTVAAGTALLTGSSSYSGGTTINGGATLSVGNGGTTGSIFNGIVDNGTLVLNRSNALTLSGVISGTGDLTKTGAGQFNMTGTNTYSGVTTISAGILQIGNGTTAGQIGSGVIVDNATLQVNHTDAVTLSNAITGTGGFVQAGTGTTTLNRGGYSGATLVNAGTLKGGNNNALGLSSAATVATGATLDLNGFAQAVGSLAGAGTVTNSGSTAQALNIGGDNSNATFSGVIQDGAAATGLTKVGTGTLVLTGANTYSLATSVNGGILQLGTGASLAAASNLIVGATGTFDLNGQTQTVSAITGTAGGAITLGNGALTVSGTTTASNAALISGTGSLAKAGTGSLFLTADNTYSGGTTISGGTLSLGSNSTAGSVTGNITDNGTLQFSRSNAYTFAGVISGTGTVFDNGTGVITLTGNNTYSGATTIFAGNTIQVGNGGTSGALGTGSISDAGSLIFNRSDSVTVANTIAGVGAVTMSRGTVILTGSSSYSGGTTIASGATLQLGNGGTTGSLFNGIADNGSLVLNRSSALTLSGVISGSGSLTQAGSGQFSMTGANAYTGTTTISAGILQIGNGGTVGQIGTGAITDNATLQINHSDAVTLANVIGGTGTLVQAGSGITTLSAASTYTGATSVNAGTLNVTGAIASSAVTVASGATLQGTGTVGAVTSTGGTLSAGGAGSVGILAVKGNLALDAASTMTVDVAPSAADMITVGGTAAIAGTVNATFASGTFTAPTTYTLVSSTGTLSGTFASYNVTGLANNFSSALSYDAHDVFLLLTSNLSATSTANVNSGTTTVSGNQTVGGLSSSGSGGTVAVSSGSTLTVSQNSDTSFAGTIAGSGAVTKTGSGTLILDGANTYTGGTTLAGGTLEIGDANNPGASIQGPVNVASGGTLQGHGTINGAVTIGAGGTLQPGGTIGTLHVASASFASGSTYTVETNAAGQGDLLAASGAINIAGGTNLVIAPDAPLGSYGRSTTYSILQAGGGISGTFSSVTSTAPSLLASVNYTANAASLTLVRPDLVAAAANTTNQRSAAAALVAGGAPVLATLAPQSDAAVQQGFGQLSGEIHASLRSVALEDSRLIRNTVLKQAAQPADGISVWATGFGGYGGIGSDGNSASLHHDEAGMIAGVDMPLGYDLRAGLGGAYTQQNADIASQSSRASGTTGHVIGYVNWTQDAYRLELGGAYGAGTDNVTRQITSLGEIDGGKQSSHVAQIFGRAGYVIATDAASVEPYVGLASVSALSGSFAEAGGAYALSGASKSDNETYATVGIRGAIAHYDVDGMLLTPRLDIGWQHAFGRVASGQAFSFASGQGFTVAGAPLAVDSAAVQAGLDLAILPNASLSIGYDGNLSSRIQSHAVAGAVRWSF